LSGTLLGLLDARGRGKFRKKVIPPSNIVNKGGGRYQGFGAGDKAMVAGGPNCLVGSKRVDDLWIPP
jgi:hypothetical protein